jgi:hypothetical protein
MVTSFEKSNPGYQWNWDEASIVGKTVGILFRNEEWEVENRTGWAVRPFKAISVDSVRSNDFTLPKDKPLKNKTTATAGYQESSYNNYNNYGNYGNYGGFTELADDNGELPL